VRARMLAHWVSLPNSIIFGLPFHLDDVIIDFTASVDDLNMIVGRVDSVFVEEKVAEMEGKGFPANRLHLGREVANLNKCALVSRLKLDRRSAIFKQKRPGFRTYRRRSSAFNAGLYGDAVNESHGLCRRVGESVAFCLGISGRTAKTPVERASQSHGVWQISGGLKVKPGEVSLAHLGVLFLDELPEFQRAVLDSLRQPLETGTVSVARANAHVTFPARVQLIAAMNPCRCGHLGDAALACSRAPRCAADYQAKVSGPMLDRIDLHVDVAAVSAADLVLPPPAEGSAEVRARVGAARAVQTVRYGPDGPRTNAEVDGDLLEEHATPDEPGRRLLAQAAEAMRLSARGYTRILRVARTIADLGNSEGVSRIHIAEALSYRRQAPRN
jgi:Magnesium chelatase, subunit ChlI/Magnesium chelatase, subunit ChlI C-terminal